MGAVLGGSPMPPIPGAGVYRACGAAGEASPRPYRDRAPCSPVGESCATDRCHRPRLVAVRRCLTPVLGGPVRVTVSPVPHRRRWIATVYSATMGSLAPRPFVHGAVVGSVGLAGAIGAWRRCWWQVGGSSRALRQGTGRGDASLVAAGAVLPRARAAGGLR